MIILHKHMSTCMYFSICVVYFNLFPPSLLDLSSRSIGGIVAGVIIVCVICLIIVIIVIIAVVKIFVCKNKSEYVYLIQQYS